VQSGAPEQGATEGGPGEDPGADPRFRGSPDSAGAPGDSSGTEGTVVCVCESEDCSHSSEEEEEEERAPQGRRRRRGSGGGAGGGVEEAQEGEWRRRRRGSGGGGCVP